MNKKDFEVTKEGKILILIDEITDYKQLIRTKYWDRFCNIHTAVHCKKKDNSYQVPVNWDEVIKKNL